MKRSQWDLIGQRIREIRKPNKLSGIFERWAMGNEVPIEVVIPEYDFIRAESFVEDVREFSALRISLIDVAAVLFEDYIAAVRSGAASVADITEDLKRRIHYLTNEQKIRSLEPITPNHWRANERIVKQQVRYVQITLQIQRKHALRSEILLQDVHRLDPTVNLKLESLISILLIDFVREVQGNQQKMINGMVNALMDRV